MAQWITSLTFITLLTGWSLGQLPPGIGQPPEGKVCRMEDIMKCFSDAIKSYVRNTEGEEAAKLPPTPEITQKVSGAISADMTKPGFDVNGTCEVLINVDVIGFAQCITNLGKKCDMTSDKKTLEAEGIRVIPPMRALGAADLQKLLQELCTTECIYVDLPSKFESIEVHWERAEYALDLYNEGHGNWTASSQECRDISHYLIKQWELSQSCPMLISMMKDYHIAQIDLINMCAVNLPKAALPLTDTGDSGANVLGPAENKLLVTILLSILTIRNYDH